MAANLLLACAEACISVAASIDGMVEPETRLLLSCTGTLRTNGAAMSPIVADGMIDLARNWVYGFGLGGAPIIYVSETQIGFSSDRAGQAVDGSLDRRSGKATITVRVAPGSTTALMSFDLMCRFREPLS